MANCLFEKLPTRIYNELAYVRRLMIFVNPGKIYVVEPQYRIIRHIGNKPWKKNLNPKDVLRHFFYKREEYTSMFVI